LPEGLQGWSFVSGGDYFCPVNKDPIGANLDPNQMLIDGRAEGLATRLLEQYAFVIVLTSGFDSQPAAVRMLACADGAIISAQLGEFTQQSYNNITDHFNEKTQENCLLVVVPAA
jgi:hypothetical protein